jgi:predicted RNase H-like nuclease (RuvC/YqgF family)
MEPEEVNIKDLAKEVSDLKREMKEMKKPIRSLLQELVDNVERDEDEFYDFN